MCKEYVNYQTGEKLDLEKVVTLPNNALLKVKPELWCEWDFEKNNELGFDIYKVTKGSQKKAWWICEKCKSSYDTNFNNKHNNNKCPYCTGKKVNHTNSLASLKPELASEWHPEKNGELSPHDVTCNSNRKVWWLGSCGHEWETMIASRNKGNGCLYCANQKVLKGFNDMWTTNPEMASLLANPEDGYKYTQNSHSKLDWRCPKCDGIVINKDIRSVSKFRLACSKCSDGKSYPEKFIANLLSELNITFESEKVFTWCTNRRYDFYISSLNMIIEIHGGQHSGDRGFERAGGRTIEEEQRNDKFKRELALQNGIEHYVVIDAMYSELEYIKDNVLSSKLKDMFNLTDIDWSKIGMLSESSLVKSVSELWDSGLKRIKLICEKTNLNKNTVTRYLKRGSALGWCDYEVGNGHKYLRVSVVKISPKDNSTTIYSSLTEARKDNESSTARGITKVCQGKSDLYQGYKWMYLEDYIKLNNKTS